MENKFKKIGVQFRWFGIAVFLSGIFMALLEASGGVIIIALGVIVAVQGAIIEYVFN